jgi:hypothetical protein
MVDTKRWKKSDDFPDFLTVYQMDFRGNSQYSKFMSSGKFENPDRFSKFFVDVLGDWFNLTKGLGFAIELPYNKKYHEDSDNSTLILVFSPQTRKFSFWARLFLSGNSDALHYLYLPRNPLNLERTMGFFRELTDYDKAGPYLMSRYLRPFTYQRTRDIPRQSNNLLFLRLLAWANEYYLLEGQEFNFLLRSIRDWMRTRKPNTVGGKVNSAKTNIALRILTQREIQYQKDIEYGRLAKYEFEKE